MRLYSLCAGLAAATATLAGCHRDPEWNVMNMEAVCDTVPPPVRPGENLRAVVPTDVHSARDSAVVVGTVTEVITGRVIAGAAVILTRGADTSSLAQRVATVRTNSSGGFVVSVAPGAYTFTPRVIGQLPVRQSLTLRAGEVDTLRLEMRYLSCHGY
jgi:hypothetical protein